MATGKKTKSSDKDGITENNGKLSFNLLSDTNILRILSQEERYDPSIMSWHQVKEEEGYRKTLEAFYDRHLFQHYLDYPKSSERDFLRQWIGELHAKTEALKEAGIKHWTEQKEQHLNKYIDHIKEVNGGSLIPWGNLGDMLMQKKQEIELNELTWRKINLSLKLLRLKAERETRKPDESKRISFKFTGKEKDLQELYVEMRGRWIDEETTWEQFKAVFNEQPLREIIPIKWHDNTASEMLYFVVQMRDMGIVEWKQNTKHNHLQMEACFVAPDGNRFKKAWPQIIPQLGTRALSEEKRKAIDEFLNDFQKRALTL